MGRYGVSGSMALGARPPRRLHWARRPRRFGAHTSIPMPTGVDASTGQLQQTARDPPTRLGRRRLLAFDGPRHKHLVQPNSDPPRALSPCATCREVPITSCNKSETAPHRTPQRGGSRHKIRFSPALIRTNTHTHILPKQYLASIFLRMSLPQKLLSPTTPSCLPRHPEKTYQPGISPQRSLPDRAFCDNIFVNKRFKSSSVLMAGGYFTLHSLLGRACCGHKADHDNEIQCKNSIMLHAASLMRFPTDPQTNSTAQSLTRLPAQ